MTGGVVELIFDPARRHRMLRWVYPLAFLFLIFLIFTDPTGAGNIAAAFVAFVGELFSALGEFLAGLFGGSGSGGTSTNAGNGPTLSNPAVTVPTSPHTFDTFHHGHTHGYTGG